MSILRQSQGDSIGRPKERNCTIKENRNNFQVMKYQFDMVYTYEFVYINYSKYAVSRIQLYTLTIIYILIMTQ